MVRWIIVKAPCARMHIEDQFDGDEDREHDLLVDDNDDRFEDSWSRFRTSGHVLDQAELFVFKLVILFESALSFLVLLGYYVAIEWSDKIDRILFTVFMLTLVWYIDWPYLLSMIY